MKQLQNFVLLDETSTSSTSISPSSSSQRQRRPSSTFKACDTDYHQLQISDLQNQLNTDAVTGIDSDLASSLLKAHGRNELTPPPRESDLVQWLKHVFTGVFNSLLWIASISQMILYYLYKDDEDVTDLVVAIVLMLVVTSSGSFDFYQEKKSEKIMSAFGNFTPNLVTVIREGKMFEMPAEELVRGDLVMLQAGNKIPADVIVVAATNDMKVDNSSLTGESEPQRRSAKCTNQNVMYTQNVCFFGTLLLNGKGKGIVFQTGDGTLLGNIAKLSSRKSGESRFAKQVKEFVQRISFVALLFGVFCVFFGVLKEDSPRVILCSTIAVIISNIPEGLLPTVTLSLTLSASKLRKKSVCVRKLESIETLGSVNVICSDKTGTITTGQMVVSHIFVPESGMETFGGKTSATHCRNAKASLCRIGVLCNNAHIERDVFGEMSAGTQCQSFIVKGTPTETAIMRCSIAMNGGIERVDSLKSEYETVHEIPFNSDNKWHLTIHTLRRSVDSTEDTTDFQLMESRSAEESQNKTEPYLMQVKGAPEGVLQMCGYYYDANNERQPLDADMETVIRGKITCAAKKGERVLCFAESFFTVDAAFQFQGECFDTANWYIDGAKGGHGVLTLVGFMSIVDPPRVEVASSVEQCYKAGIKVVMVTGDHSVTASAIARQVGIINDYNRNTADIDIECGALNRHKVVVGGDIDKILRIRHINEAQYGAFWDSVLSFDCLVFARTTPTHKMVIVSEFQQRGMVVAVTGDGVNDAPALNQADVGIAMGLNGTDVARDAADIVLMNDKFSSIVDGISEGRLIRCNLKKSIIYTLCSKLPQFAPFIAQNLFGWPLAMTLLQTLLIDLGTDVWTAIAMAYEHREADDDGAAQRKVAMGIDGDAYDNKKDEQTLVTWGMMAYSYLYVGVIQSIACFVVFQRTMFNGGKGIHFNDCVSISGVEWDKIIADRAETLFCYNEFGRCYFGDEFEFVSKADYTLDNAAQQRLLRDGQTAFYMALVLMQISAAICCSTRISSVFVHGMRNKWLNLCLVMEFVLAVAIVFVPLLQDIFETRAEPLKSWGFWMLIIPFMASLVAIEEFRKRFKRNHPTPEDGHGIIWHFFEKVTMNVRGRLCGLHSYVYM